MSLLPDAIDTVSVVANAKVSHRDLDIFEARCFKTSSLAYQHIVSIYTQYVKYVKYVTVHPRQLVHCIHQLVQLAGVLPLCVVQIIRLQYFPLIRA